MCAYVRVCVCVRDAHPRTPSFFAFVIIYKCVPHLVSYLVPYLVPLAVSHLARKRPAHRLSAVSLSVSLSVPLAVPSAVPHPVRTRLRPTSACRRRRVGGVVGRCAVTAGTDVGVSSAACRRRRLRVCWVLAAGGGGAVAGGGWGLGLGDSLLAGVLGAGVFGLSTEGLGAEGRRGAARPKRTQGQQEGLGVLSKQGGLECCGFAMAAESRTT